MSTRTATSRSADGEEEPLDARRRGCPRRGSRASSAPRPAPRSPARAAASATAAGPAPPAAAATASTAGSTPCSAAGSRRPAGRPAGRRRGPHRRGQRQPADPGREQRRSSDGDDRVEHRRRLPRGAAARRGSPVAVTCRRCSRCVSGLAGRLLLSGEEPAQLSGARTATGRSTDQPGQRRRPPPSSAQARSRPARRQSTNSTPEEQHRVELRGDPQPEQHAGQHRPPPGPRPHAQGGQRDREAGPSW